MLTNVVDVKITVEAIKGGAYDFVGKPYDVEQLFATVRRALEHRQLLIEREISKSGQPKAVIGESQKFKEVVAHTVKIAASETFVLILGESGTGKELFAQLIHKNSQRKDQPFMAVNCAAMPDQLLESELFGHEKGSFTDAHKAKQGLVEVANGGTLFLDEVGDISISIQPKILRFLESGEFRRVGGTATKKTDVRVISATNKKLDEEVRAGRFRADLLYRLNALSLQIPPLRERRDDIPKLAEHFLGQKSKTKRLSYESLKILMKHNWPGNIRELKNVIEGAIAVSSSDVIEPKDLFLNNALGDILIGNQSSTDGTNEHLTMDEIEKLHIEKVLKKNNWNRIKTAQVLGITPKTLYLKIKRYEIRIGSEEIRN
jgi:DNA-binding NtrC family response regulator